MKVLESTIRPPQVWCHAITAISAVNSVICGETAKGSDWQKTTKHKKDQEHKLWHQTRNQKNKDNFEEFLFILLHVWLPLFYPYFDYLITTQLWYESRILQIIHMWLSYPTITLTKINAVRAWLYESSLRCYFVFWQMNIISSWCKQLILNWNAQISQRSTVWMKYVTLLFQYINNQSMHSLISIHMICITFNKK